MSTSPSMPGFIDLAYLTAMGRVMRPAKHRSYDALRLRPTDRVLDVSCGPGLDTVALAQHLGPRSRVVEVDHDAVFVHAAEAHAQQAGVADRVSHVLAEGTVLSTLLMRYVPSAC